MINNYNIVKLDTNDVVIKANSLEEAKEKFLDYKNSISLNKMIKEEREELKDFIDMDAIFGSELFVLELEFQEQVLK